MEVRTTNRKLTTLPLPCPFFLRLRFRFLHSIDRCTFVFRLYSWNWSNTKRISILFFLFSFLDFEKFRAWMQVIIERWTFQETSVFRNLVKSCRLWRTRRRLIASSFVVHKLAVYGARSQRGQTRSSLITANSPWLIMLFGRLAFRIARVPASVSFPCWIFVRFGFSSSLSLPHSLRLFSSPHAAPSTPCFSLFCQRIIDERRGVLSSNDRTLARSRFTSVFYSPELKERDVTLEYSFKRVARGAAFLWRFANHRATKANCSRYRSDSFSFSFFLFFYEAQDYRPLQEACFFVILIWRA